MNPLLSFLTEYLFASVMLFGGYILVRKYMEPSIRRGILYAVLVLPLAMPFIHISEYNWLPDSPPNVTIEQGEQLTSPSNEGLDRTVVEVIPLIPSNAELRPNAPEKNEADVYTLLKWIYLAGSGMLLLRLLISMTSLILLFRNSGIQEVLGYRVRIVSSHSFAGASFFRHIFLNREYLESKEVRTILLHESIHCEKGHTLDALLAELHLAIFWINPVAWFLRHELRINAELEADLGASMDLDQAEYISGLISVSINSPGVLMMRFSKTSLKRRLHALEQKASTKWKKAIPLLFMITLFALGPVACTDPIDRENLYLSDKTMGEIRKITTTYISHQDDTEEKDDQIVSVAYFKPDQSLERLYNMTSYPYTSTTPSNREFFASPDTHGLFTIMDGLTMEYAERNFLYGNDWPRVVAEAAENGRSVKSYGGEGDDVEFEISYDGNLPVSIINSREYRYKIKNDDHETVQKFLNEQKFSYEGNKISHFIEGQHTTMGGQSSDHSKNQNFYVRDEVMFEYSGNKLTKMTSGKKSWVFLYEGEKMVSSEFWINDKRYNRRTYFYNENGLKLRTEIYNLYNEPEYTIKYSYEFFQDSNI
jgi:hypothetical protein